MVRSRTQNILIIGKKQVVANDSDELYVVVVREILIDSDGGRMAIVRRSRGFGGTSASTPLTPEELKVDKIVLSWILFTLFDSLRARLVVARPKSAKEAWSLISKIVKDNKSSSTNALKVELRSIKLGDQSMKSYFQKINPIVTILTSLDAYANDEDVVHYALEGLLDIYNQICGYMHWKDTFLDLKTVHSLLLTKEMRLKSKALASPMHSSYPMVLVAESSNNSRSSSKPQVGLIRVVGLVAIQLMIS
nr:hybrid signal transduction histidine kinase M [Tanacetum cinerariifolium]